MPDGRTSALGDEVIGALPVLALKTPESLNLRPTQGMGRVRPILRSHDGQMPLSEVAPIPVEGDHLSMTNLSLSTYQCSIFAELAP